MAPNSEARAVREELLGEELMRVEVEPAVLTLSVGERAQLMVTVDDSRGKEPASGVRWSSSDPSVASVDAVGTVEAVSPGFAAIHAATGLGTGRASVRVLGERTGGAGGPPANPPPSAFPGAQGWGAKALTRCNRSQVQVLRVTNLADGGAGSLRDAIARVRDDVLSVVVFDVAGIIRLGDRIEIERSCLYIAGQTAPGGGITIANSGSVSLFLRGPIHDIAIRYLRMRGGFASNRTGQLNILVGSGHDIILDHLSLSWTSDKLIAITKFDQSFSTPIHDVTLQRSILSEIFAWHPTASSISGEPRHDPPIWNIDVHHNLFAHNSHRNPLVSTRGARIANNVVYNWLQGASHGESRSVADFIGNYYKPGPMTHADLRYEVTYLCDGGSPGAGPDFYVSGNVGPHNSDPNAGPHSQWEGDRRVVACYNDRDGTPLTDRFPDARRDEPLPAAALPISLESADAAYTSVLQDVGADARLDCRGRLVPEVDAIDRRVLSEVTAGEGLGAPLRHESSVGGFPVPTGSAPCADSDTDGMPDEFEHRMGFAPMAADAWEDHDRDGYTNLEEYLNGR